MFMGHIGVPTKKLVKGNECFLYFISAICVAPATLIILFTSPSGILGCCMLSDNVHVHVCFNERLSFNEYI